MFWQIRHHVSRDKDSRNLQLQRIKAMPKFEPVHPTQLNIEDMAVRLQKLWVVQRCLG
jgi:hypothetical protein